MSTNEAGDNIERNAKELLSSLQADCPDKVWQDLIFELEQAGEGGERNWNVSRKTLWIIVLSLLLAGLVIFILARYSSSRKNLAPSEVPPAPALQPHAIAPVIQPPAKPLQSSTVPPIAHDTAGQARIAPVVSKKRDTIIARDSQRVKRSQPMPVAVKRVLHKESKNNFIGLQGSTLPVL